MSERGKQFYFDELPKIIKTRFEAFDSRVIETLHSPLIDEIEQNLQGCQNAVERDSYIFSLITPFAKLSSIIHPIAEIDNLKKRISDIEKDIEYWNKENPDEQLKGMAVAATGTPREQLEACREEIDRLNWQVERKEEVSNKFVNLICGNILEDGTVEDCLCAMLGIMGTYSDRLFAMLIQHGIDIRTYQKKAGIYLKQDWLITDIYFHVGSMELAQYYLDHLPTATINDEQPQLNQDKQPATAQPDTGKKKGRPTKTFKDLMLNDEGGEHLKKIHNLMNGKSGKDAGLIMLACIKKGWITKPTRAQVTKEFGNIGSKQGFLKYLTNEYSFTNDELEGVMNSLN